MRLVRFLGALTCAGTAFAWIAGCSGSADRASAPERAAFDRGDDDSTSVQTSANPGKASSSGVSSTSGGSGAAKSGSEAPAEGRTSAGADDIDSYASSPGSSAVVAPEPSKASASTDAGVSTPPVLPVLDGSKLTAGLWDDNANYDVFARFWNATRQSTPTGLPEFTNAMTSAVRDSYAQRRSHNAIDIALMLDTTGSMSDELQYLQAELLNISREVAQQFPTADVHWSLVAYRDDGDDYVTRAFDFSADVEAFRKNLAAQAADGGGDMPEAVAKAFGVTLTQSWRGAAAAQMVLWVADAPHHDSDAQSVQGSISKAKEMGIHIYPVASSNANALAEATMRAAAQYTGGRYLFLTDDSGIGGSHAEPKVPCYYVTKLDDAIVRSIGMELTGRYVPPSTKAIVRIVGTPVDATCAASSPVTDAGSDVVALDEAGDAAASEASAFDAMAPEDGDAHLSTVDAATNEAGN